jgi:HK97 family phage major capsid protein
MSTKIRQLQAEKAAKIQAARAIQQKAEAEKRDFTAEEDAQFVALTDEAKALQSRIDREAALLDAEAGLGEPGEGKSARGPPAGGGTVVELPGDGKQIRVEENLEKDPKRGFKVFGEFAQAVRGAAAARLGASALDKRLLVLGGMQAAAPTTFAGEGTGADGGFLIPPDFASAIFQLSLGEDSLLPMTDNTPVQSNGMVFPKDETTPWGTNGIRAYWQNEAGAATATKPVVGAAELRLKKLMAFVPISDEMLQDAGAMSAYIPDKVATSIRWKTNEAILWGVGGGIPLGALQGAAAIVVSKDSGQASNTLSALNLANMIARLPPGSYPRAVWMINNDVLPALFTLTLGNYPIYIPAGAAVNGGIQQNPYGLLLGRPITISQHAKSFSSQGDVTLLDLKYYQAITKADGMQTATSMHFYFDSDAMAFRTTFRMDGQPKLSAAITPANGSNNLSPFVQLQAR